MSTSNTPPEGVTLMDLLPGFTLIATPVAGLFGSRHHGLSGIGLGLACGTVIGAAGFFMSKGLISTIEAVCARCSSESEDSEEDSGCALQVAILGLLLLLTAIAPAQRYLPATLCLGCPAAEATSEAKPTPPKWERAIC